MSIILSPIIGIHQSFFRSIHVAFKYQVQAGAEKLIFS